MLRAGATGATPEINSYDEYGQPATTNEGRFQYTGQAWLPELGMYYYKARIYSPTLGRFLQTDPIGYEDQYNLYAYVGNDPINLVDFTGLQAARPKRFPVIPIYGPGNPAPAALDQDGNGWPDWAEEVAQGIQDLPDNIRQGWEDLKGAIFNNDEEVDTGAAGEIPDLTGQSEGDAAGTLTEGGFEDKGTTEGGYRKFYHPDGSRVQVGPDGRVIRTGPKIQNPDPNQAGHRPRVDQNGQPTDLHDTGERVERE